MTDDGDILVVEVERINHDALEAVPAESTGAFADMLSEQPEGVRIEIEQTGPYTPGPRHVVSRLTERQREVLGAAIELGYYQEPREATHDEIAVATGLAEMTVGEHLRKIEATVFSSLHVGAAHR